MKDLEKIRNIVISDGIELSGPHPAPSSDVKTAEKFRTICKTDTCGNYNKSWTCPPAVGVPKDCIAKLKEFKEAMIITKTFPIDLNDKAMLEGIIVEHQSICRGVKRLFLKEGFDVLALTDGRCTYCEKCSYPESCIAPAEQMPSVSGFGIDMSKYITGCGIEFSFSKTSATLYGIIMYK